MRIVDQVHHQTSSLVLDTRAAEKAHVSVYSGAVDGGAAARARSESENRPGQSKSEPAESRRPIAAAMYWLVAQLIEAFAAHGEGIHPGPAYQGELIDDQELEQGSQRHCQTQDERWSEVPWLNATRVWTSEELGESARPQTDRPGWSRRITARVARFWSRMHSKQSARLAITRLETLDDHMLKDIGIHRCQIESGVRHGDRY
jgi:uncharacterized protein YjiS (DUF1127 family)